MFNNLQNLGWGLVGFALIIGMGSVILHRFGGAVAECRGINSTFTWNNTENKCCAPTSTYDCEGANGSTPAGTGWVNTDYLLTELGSTGLAGWTPAIVAISVGMLIFGAFLAGGGTGRKY